MGWSPGRGQFLNLSKLSNDTSCTTISRPVPQIIMYVGRERNVDAESLKNCDGSWVQTPAEGNISVNLSKLPNDASYTTNSHS